MIVILFIFRQGAECELTMPSLGVLTNLCRNNIAVQAQVKALVWPCTVIHPPCTPASPLLNLLSQRRICSVYGGGGVHIHIFKFCLTDFFSKSISSKKLVGQNLDTWICPLPQINALDPTLCQTLEFSTMQDKWKLAPCEIMPNAMAEIFARQIA